MITTLLTRAAYRGAAGLALAACLLTPTAAASAAVPASTASLPATRTAGQTITMPVQDALASLPVAAEDRAGYQRTAFKHWTDADGDGCNTRQEVLKMEAIIAPEQGARCSLTGGRWYSAYDDTYIDGPSGLDIDHLVPLAEAWDSGASTWTAKEREAYANDLSDPRDLIAVSARSNRAKGDKDPTDWLPPATNYDCTYVTDWVTDKMRWGLSVDPAEHDALARGLADCPNLTVSVTTAR